MLFTIDIMGHVVFGCNFDAVSNAEAPMYKNFKTVLQTYSNRYLLMIKHHYIE